MEIEILTTRSQVDAIFDQWDGLPRPSTMQSPTWLLAWWQTYRRSDRQLAVVTVWKDKRLVAVAPWYSEGRSHAKRLRWLGDGQVCSDHATILCRAESRDDVACSLACWVSEQLARNWKRLVLDSVNQDDDTCQQFFHALIRLGQPVTRSAAAGSCCVYLPSTWDDYLDGVSKNHRKKCRRAVKQWIASGRARVEVCRTGKDCRAALKQLAALHGERRRAKQERSVFDSSRFAKFHDQVVAELADQQRAQVRLVWIDDRPVAAEYVLLHNKTYFAYQSGLAASGLDVSAGMVSLVTMIQDAIGQGYERLDLLRGVEPYKFSWGAVHRPAETITIHRPTTAGQIGAWYETAWDRARHLKRRLTQPT